MSKVASDTPILDALSASDSNSGIGRTLLAIREVAERWGVSSFTVRRRLENGELRSVRIGSRRLIPLREVERVENATR